MNGTIELKKAIMINDKKVQKLKYDTDEITSELFAEAESKKMKASGSKGGNLSGAMELDYCLHLYLGFASIIAVNGDYAFEDLERVKGPDLIQITKVGRNFLIASGASADDNSDEQSETTPDASTPQSATSKKED